jgi:ADP-ribosylglycohydrolase
VRVTWIQAEDLIGHELRQASEEGKQVDDVERRWLEAGGQPAPPRGASPEPASAELRSLALELVDELAGRPRPRAADEPDEPDELEAILAAAPGVDALPAAVVDDLAGRLEGAWLGRAVGCLLGKPVESISRQGIRELLEATGRWPLRDYFTAQGLPDAVAERWPWNRASRTTSLAESVDGMPEDDDLNFTILALSLVERTGTELTTLDVAKAWLDYLPPGRIFTAERVACRNLLLGLLPPETAVYRNPFREWIGARLRVDVYGWVAGDPVLAAELAWRDARLSHRANGVYAAMFMAAAHAASLTGCAPSEAADIGLGVVPARSRLADALRLARDLACGHEWEDAVDCLYEHLGSLHWVHAINNTALVAAAMYTFDDFDSAICGVVQGGWDTDTNGAAVGSIFGACMGADGIDSRWSDPLHDTIASSLPGFDGIGIRELARRTHALVRTRTPVA